MHLQMSLGFALIRYGKIHRCGNDCHEGGSLFTQRPVPGSRRYGLTCHTGPCGEAPGLVRSQRRKGNAGHELPLWLPQEGKEAAGSAELGLAGGVVSVGSGSPSLSDPGPGILRREVLPPKVQEQGRGGGSEYGHWIGEPVYESHLLFLRIGGPGRGSVFSAREPPGARASRV